MILTVEKAKTSNMYRKSLALNIKIFSRFIITTYFLLSNQLK